VYLHQRVDLRKTRYSGSVDFYTPSRVFQKHHVRIGVRIRGYTAEAEWRVRAGGAIRELVYARDFEQRALAFALLPTASSEPYDHQQYEERDQNMP
jgi:hypothetical protein